MGVRHPRPGHCRHLRCVFRNSGTCPITSDPLYVVLLRKHLLLSCFRCWLRFLTNRTTATANAPRTSRRTNNGHTAVPGTSTSTGNIPARSPPVASEASRAPARQRHTDGRAAWNGRSLVAAAPPGASAGWSLASNLAPRLLISTTTPSSGGPPEQPNVLQGAYHPHYQDYQGGLHSNAPPAP